MADSKPQPEERDQTETPSIDEMAEEALQSASAAADALQAEMGGQPGKLELPSFDHEAGGEAPDGALGLLSDVNLQVKVELGRTRMYIEDVLRLNADSVVELDKAAGDPVDVYVNDRLVARGEVLVLEDNFCVRISEILQPARSSD